MTEEVCEERNTERKPRDKIETHKVVFIYQEFIYLDENNLYPKNAIQVFDF